MLLLGFVFFFFLHLRKCKKFLIWLSFRFFKIYNQSKKIWTENQHLGIFKLTHNELLRWIHIIFNEILEYDNFN